MINLISLFTSVTSVVSTTVQLPNGAIALVTHIGTVRILGSLILTDVLCVPSFNFNLISVSKLIKQFCCCLIFLHHHCFIQNLSPWKTIRVGKENNGLYFLMLQSHYLGPDLLNSIPQVSQVQSTYVKASSLPTDLWHYRLGHSSSSRINLLHNLVPSIPCDSNNISTVCPLAKHHKLPFVHSNSVTCFSFDLIHCDIWGPFPTHSIKGSNFFLTIVNDHSRFTWVHLMKHKSQTRSILQHFFLYGFYLVSAQNKMFEIR